MKILLWVLQAVVLAVVLMGSALAQSFPTKPVRIVVPFPPGGTADALARMVSPMLTEIWGQPIVVDNKPGANTIIGAEHVARSAPDGYTLLLTLDSTLAINPLIYSKLPYDPQRDFAPVTVVAYLPLVLVVNASVPANSLQELIALAKARPGGLNHASIGVGSPQHLTMALLKSIAGVDIVHIPYKGGAPATADLLAGQVHTLIGGIPTNLPHIKSGKVRALAVTSTRRSSSLPDVPAIAETYPGYDASVWIGLLAPAGTPAAIVGKLQTDVARVVRHPGMRERFVTQSFEPGGNSPEEFAALIRADNLKWSRIVKEAGIKGE